MAAIRHKGMGKTRTRVSSQSCLLVCLSLLRYITAAYWSITTMTTVGYGDITAVRIDEKIVACVVMMAGTSMFAYMMGSVVSQFL